MTDSNDPLDLLEEWMTYWHEQDHMPAKMPRALHVRTAMALAMSGREVPGVDGLLAGDFTRRDGSRSTFYGPVDLPETRPPEV